MNAEDVKLTFTRVLHIVARCIARAGGINKLNIPSKFDSFEMITTFDLQVLKRIIEHGIVKDKRLRPPHGYQVLDFMIEYKYREEAAILNYGQEEMMKCLDFAIRQKLKKDGVEKTRDWVRDGLKGFGGDDKARINEIFKSAKNEQCKV
jgi:hypothetical protein